MVTAAAETLLPTNGADTLGLTLAQWLVVYDIAMSLALLIVVQISTRLSGFYCEYSVRSLLRRIVYYAVIIVLCYRAYAIANQYWFVTVSAALSNVVMIFCILVLACMDAIWERGKRNGFSHRPSGAASAKTIS